MITELSWLQWQRGNRQRAAAALGAVTDFLTANVDVDSERFRESFRKAGHVIGWMGGVAEGEPPKLLAEMHFQQQVSLTSIGQAIAASQGGQNERLTILYLALIAHPDAAPRDICGAEVVCLSAFNAWEPIARSPLVDFAVVVQRTWRQIVRDRAFALNAPRLLRNALEAYPAPSVANAARVLMAAQAATAARLDQSLHKFLAKTAETAT